MIGVGSNGICDGDACSDGGCGGVGGVGYLVWEGKASVGEKKGKVQGGKRSLSVVKRLHT